MRLFKNLTYSSKMATYFDKDGAKNWQRQFNRNSRVYRNGFHARLRSITDEPNEVWYKIEICEHGEFLGYYMGDNWPTEEA